jgi:hypothetical protein
VQFTQIGWLCVVDSEEDCTMKNCTDCADTELLTYVHVKRLKWAGHVVWMFHNRITKRIVDRGMKSRKVLVSLRDGVASLGDWSPTIRYSVVFKG